MIAANDTPSHKGPDKDKHFQDQFNIVYKEFFNHPQTMKQVEVKTGIDRAYICWYCRRMRLAEQIKAHKKDLCPITKYPKVTYWTTNPALFPTKNQLNLFHNE